jgi:hypothetical protein
MQNTFEELTPLDARCVVVLLDHYQLLVRPRLTDFENFVEERNAANPANYQALSLAGEADGR